MSVSRPVLRYHGAKWRIANWIISHFPEHRVYVEPFGGSAAVLLRKERSYAEVYNDVDGEIVNVFQVLRDRGDELIRAVWLTPYSRSEFELSYSPEGDCVEQARRTICRAFMGHGTTGTTSRHKTGFRSRAFLSRQSPAVDFLGIPDGLIESAARFRGVVIEQQSAPDVMRRYDSPETLHYLDPPYVKSTRSAVRDSRECYRHDMDESEHVALAETVKSLQGMIIISGYPSELYAELYDDWTVSRKYVRADRAAPRMEVLWVSPNAVRQQEMFSEQSAAFDLQTNRGTIEGAG